MLVRRAVCSCSHVAGPQARAPRLVANTHSRQHMSRRRAALLREPLQPSNTSPRQHGGSADRAAAATQEAADERQLLLAKAYNFVAGAQGVVFWPFLNMFLAAQGLTSGQVGLLAALRTWGAAPVGLAATAAADRFQLHRQLLLGGLVVSCALRSSLPLLHSPWLLFGVLLAADLAGGPVNVLADSLVLSNCNEAAGEGYGKQRQWGSIGFGAASIPAGWLIHAAGLNAAFLVFAVASVPLVAITSQMRFKYSSSAVGSSSIDVSRSSSSSSSSSGGGGGGGSKPGSAAPASAAAGSGAQLQQLLRQPAVLVFLWRCLLLGMGMGVMGNYTFLWLKELGAPEALMGAAIAVSITTEVPAFQLQDRLLARVTPEALLNVALAATALRLALYGLLPLAGTPYAVLPIELLHGATFGLGWGAATASSSRLAPPRLAASMQGAFQAVYGGVGAGLGGLLGGAMMQSCGGRGLFFGAAAVVAAGGLAAAGVSAATHALQLRTREAPAAAAAAAAAGAPLARAKVQ